MLRFANLSVLDTHIAFLTKRLKKSSSPFLVGGCVRDLLLDVEKSPLDIDFTLAGKPETIYNSIDKEGLSHFITEKFGTITLIKKGKDIEAKKKKNVEVQYECTPLRTEGDYGDFRHPGEIHRSNDLLLDSNRRDFTVNCLYYSHHKISKVETYQTSKINEQDLLKSLEQQGIVYLSQHKLYILQNHEFINQIFTKGNFHEEIFFAITKKLNIPPHQKTVRFIIDPHKGIQDLISRKLRAVGTPDKRFQEDALRLIRALRFVNVINEKLLHNKTKPGKEIKLFDFEKNTWTAIKTNNHLLQHVAKERIKDELTKVFAKGNPFGFVALVDEVGLMEFLFPAVFATKFIHQPIRYHPFDVYTHTMLTLYELQKINKDPLVRLGMLYHDVGKVAQFAAYGADLDKDAIRDILAGPLNHRRSGPDIAKTDVAALGFSKKDCEDVARYVLNHHKPEEILAGGNPEKTTKKLRKFLSEAGIEKVQNILDITMADRLGQYNPLQNSADLSDVHLLRSLLKQLHKEEGQFTVKEMQINGNDIIKQLKIEPGKLVGELLEQAFEWVLSAIKTRNKKREILQYLKGYLKNKYPPKPVEEEIEEEKKE